MGPRELFWVCHVKPARGSRIHLRVRVVTRVEGPGWSHGSSSGCATCPGSRDPDGPTGALLGMPRETGSRVPDPPPGAPRAPGRGTRMVPRELVRVRHVPRVEGPGWA